MKATPDRHYNLIILVHMYKTKCSSPVRLISPY
jgi:hypothetical protein